MTLNLLFPEPCPDCEAIDKCTENCFCPSCKADHYDQPVNPTELAAWAILAPTIRAIHERWRTPTSGPLCSLSGSGSLLYHYEVEVNSKDSTYILWTDNVSLWISLWQDGECVQEAHYGMNDHAMVAHDVDL